MFEAFGELSRAVQCSPLGTLRSHTRRAAAFTLIEILVVVTLLSVIIIGLVAMFSQTQKALVGSTTQVELLEVGRATMDQLARELEQLTPTGSATNTPNFYSYLESGSALIQPLSATNDFRTNILERLFFVTRYNQEWDAIGYRVVYTSPGVATLYKTNYSNIGVTNVHAYWVNFNNLTPSAVTNLSRIADGVVHLRVQAYDTNSLRINYSTPSMNITNNYEPVTDDYDYIFMSNAVPAFVEVELGVLENRTLERLKAFPDPLGIVNPADTTAPANFLAAHAAQVHVFRQRIPIRNVDPTAYQ